MIGIIDYGSGNVKAIANIYKRLNTDYFITSDPSELERATHLVLPGVGAFDKTMNLLNSSGLRVKLDSLVLNEKIPIVGICVGMQIMAESSEEGKESGLGWIKGTVKRIDESTLIRKPKLPHMGWNSIEVSIHTDLLDNVDLKKGFYFLHSYYVDTYDIADVIAKVDYGSNINSIIKRENIIGIQFHPEKSHQNGIEVFKNFSKTKC
ncbi:MAG: glutamine amidotransferase [Algoriphagus sp.]|jgi:glutamine amidotransferase